MKWKTKPLGELCIIEKGKIGIQKAIPGAFPLVVTAEERLTHNEYHFEGNAVIIPIVSSTGHGHKSLKRIHFQTGKFAVGNILCAVIPKDESVLNAQYLYRFLFLNKEKELVGRMRGMANVTLPLKEIANIEIPLPPIKEQLEFVEIYNKLEAQNIDLSSECTHQLSLVKQLRQAFLREAMQGKLVAQDPQDEPASETLRKVKQRRTIWIEQSIQVGNDEARTIQNKLKKLDLTVLTTPDVELPNNWVWSPMLKSVQLIVDCHNKTAPYVQTGVPLIRTTNIRNGKLDMTDTKFVTEETYRFWSKRCIPEPGDILFTREAPVGEGAIIPDNVRLCMGQRMMLIRTYDDLVSRKFLLYLITSPEFLKRISKELKGAMVGHLRIGDVENFLIPLPPLAEQRRIVAKLDELMRYCDALEASIQASREQNEGLLQQVLREALEPGNEE